MIPKKRLFISTVLELKHNFVKIYHVHQNRVSSGISKLVHKKGNHSLRKMYFIKNIS